MHSFIRARPESSLTVPQSRTSLSLRRRRTCGESSPDVIIFVLITVTNAGRPPQVFRAWIEVRSSPSGWERSEVVEHLSSPPFPRFVLWATQRRYLDVRKRWKSPQSAAFANPARSWLPPCSTWSRVDETQREYLSLKCCKWLKRYVI